MRALDRKGAATAESCERLAQSGAAERENYHGAAGGRRVFTPTTPVTQWMGSDAALYKALPAFCRVAIESQPSADSDIKIEVWLPVGDWNGKFQGRGNGGFAGEIDYHALAVAVHEGYATAGTDTGHAASGTDARWALGHPEKITDFGYRAIHEMTHKREDGDQEVLRESSAAFLFCELFEWRAAGLDGGAAFSGRL